MDDSVVSRSNEIKPVEESIIGTVTWCDTEVKSSKLSFIWTIHNFSICDKKTGEFLESSTFSRNDYDKIKWCLRLYPKGFDSSFKDYITLFLHLAHSDKNEVTAKVKFSLLDSRRKKKNFMGINEPAYSYSLKSSRGYKNFLKQSILKEEKAELLPDDKLTIYCEINMNVDAVNISGRYNSKEFKIPESHFLGNLKHLFESQEFSDIILTVKGREFNAHKVILAAHSEVFSAMFKHEMEEKKQDRVEIIDIDPDVFEEMLYFIYTGKTRNLETKANDLLIASDKYALEKLKAICEQAVFSKMSIETASDDLILADMCSAEQLKKHAIDFINAYSTNIVETKGWKNMNKYPQLVLEIYNASAKQQISSTGSLCKKFKAS